MLKLKDAIEGRTMFKPLLRVGLLVLGVLLVFPAAAQEGGTTVTKDDVNEIAREMYCPVCENIPLDDCGTAACQDWRNEIRIYLEQGWTEEMIVNDFIDRFGDQVVGTPRDPVLRAMSLITPWVLAGLLLVFVLRTILLKKGDDEPRPEESTGQVPDDLRTQLERDLNG